MSAFMMSFKDCSILADAIVAKVPSYRGHNAEALAGALYAENLESVNTRYPDTRYSPENLPGPIAEAGVRFTYVPNAAPRIGDAALCKLAHCWRYQSCEYDACKDGAGWQAVAALLALYPDEGENLPGYDDAAWGDYDPATDPARNAPIPGAADIIAALVGHATARVEGCRDNPRGLYGREFTASLKAALKRAFPGVTFRVRGSTGTGRGWYDVTWTDGPTQDEVKGVTARYQSRAFDGMTDGYNSTGAEPWQENGDWVRGTSCGIHHNRKLSDGFALALARVELAESWGGVGTLPTGSYESGTWYDQYPQEGVKGSVYHNWSTLVRRRAEGAK